MAKKSAKSKGYRKQSGKKPYLSKREIGILCAIVAVLAVGAFFLFRYDDGALKVRDGAVVTEGDNWLIVNGSNVRGGARYYKLGELGEIDGYSREKGSGLDGNVPEYTFTPEAEDNSVNLTVGCGHATAKVMASYTRSTLESLGTAQIGALETAELAGRTVEYYIYNHAPAEETAGEAQETEAAGEAAAETAEGTVEETAEATEEAAETAEATETAEANGEAEDAPYTRVISGYVDAAHDSCLMLRAESRADTAEALLSDEALTQLLEKAIQAISFEEGK